MISEGNPLSNAPNYAYPQLTTDTALSEYYERHLKGLKRPQERMSQLKRTLDSFLDQPVASIRQSDLVMALDRWDGTTRNRHRAATLHFWKFLRQREYTSLRPEIAREKEQSRRVVFELDAVRRLWQIAPLLGPWRGFCRLLILTGQRRSEVWQMKPEHVDLRQRLWTNPDTKNGLPHTVPLGTLAYSELRQHGKASEYPWTSKGDFSDLKERWFHAAGVDFEHYRFHDLRRTFVTQLIEHGAEERLVDISINHVASGTRPSGASAAYNVATRLNDRRGLMEDWERLLLPDQWNEAADVLGTMDHPDYMRA